MPVLIDSGFRRGTDIFKALALGATSVCIGRPYIWGLGAFGEAGVERVLELLQVELKLTMQLAGTTSISKITPDFVRQRPRCPSGQNQNTKVGSFDLWVKEFGMCGAGGGIPNER